MRRPSPTCSRCCRPASEHSAIPVERDELLSLPAADVVAPRFVIVVARCAALGQLSAISQETAGCGQQGKGCRESDHFGVSVQVMDRIRRAEYVILLTCLAHRIGVVE